ncbi:MAG: hypothetical protein BGP11_15015 [Rhodobacterales bacterium 65-51]|nr:MAG: hypothetical protein BGP11_15015 [Rhodobacterales bacterium 65-51]
MNEPMSSREIEDVLSSIRRLVSDDLRPAHRTPTNPPAVPGKLLLTPALRVVPAPAAAPEQPETDITGLTEEPASARRIEDVVASLGAAVEPDEAWETEAAEPEWGEASWPSLPEVVEVDLDSVAEAEVVQFVSADQARMEDAWRDGAWPDGPQPAELDEPAPVAEIDSDPAAADLAEAEVVAELSRAVEDEVAEQAAAEPGLFAPGDADDFDEEALREVVRDIIREELQGALGERITRNVRKLVRAEISRAIASRDLS